jgi:hypothetical protein
MACATSTFASAVGDEDEVVGSVAKAIEVTNSSPKNQTPNRNDHPRLQHKWR